MMRALLGAHCTDARLYTLQQNVSPDLDPNHLTL